MANSRIAQLTNRRFFKIALMGVILLIILTQFTTVGWNRMLRSSNSSDGDQNTYLAMALSIRDQGILSDGVRNPLYPAILAFFAHREWTFFTWGKILSLSFGLLTVVAVYVVGSQMFNRLTGLIGAILLSINKEFILHSTVVLTESLLSLIMLITWFVMIKALRNPAQQRFWILAGALAGLAYLSKGTGLILIMAFVMAATLLLSYRVWLQPSIWGFFVGLILTASPLWLYNWVTFGSPLYNRAINNVMWMNTAEEKYVISSTELPTVWTFLQDNSLTEIGTRVWEGVLALRFFFFKSLWPTRSLAIDEFLLVGGLDITLALLAVGTFIFWSRLKPKAIANRESLVLTGILFALFYILFSWYFGAVNTAIRFLVPLSPIFLLLFSAGLVGLLAPFFLHPRLPNWGKITATTFLLISLFLFGQWFIDNWSTNAKAIQQDLFVADATYNSYHEGALNWALEGHSNSDEVTVLWGPTHDLPTWRRSDRFISIRTPVSINSVVELDTFLKSANVTYLIFDDDMVLRRRELAKDLGFERYGNELLNFEQFPNDWALGLTAPTMPCRWCVFRRLSAIPSITTVDYHLADESIHLFGYTLTQDQFYPGGRIVLTLFWESLKPVDIDYTIFTQLLGPDFQLHGQMDRQPLAGYWPTSQWATGQKFVDKFVIDVAEIAPNGDYILLVGQYNLETGVRASISEAGQPIADNAIHLHHLSLGSKN